MKIRLIFIIPAAFLLLTGCRHSNEDTAEVDAGSAGSGTPVTITHISNQPMQSEIELTATSTYLTKTVIKANNNGYLIAAHASPGQFITNGNDLFTIQTKEAKALENSLEKIDSSYKFSGITHVYAGISGYITEINFQMGDYVQEGDQLAIVSDAKSFTFLLNVPYEYKKYIAQASILKLHLPDGTVIDGKINSALTTVDPLSQTLQYQVSLMKEQNLPENLIAHVSIITHISQKAISLPKETVLTNETQNEFWVMKLISDTVAVKVPVVKGIETKSDVEILSPAFLPDDRIILTGNYGLPDTAFIRIEPN